MAGEIAGGVILGLLILASLILFILRRQKKRKRIRDGYRLSHAIPHRDFFEIDPKTSTTGPLLLDENASFPHDHIVPFDPYAAFPSSATSSSFSSAADGPDVNTHGSAGGRPTTSSVNRTLSQSQAQSQSSLIPLDDLRHSQFSRYSMPATSSSDTKSGYQPASDRASRSSTTRHRAPEPEEDAGPVAFVVDGDDDEDAAESRAVAGSTLPPVYSSVATSNLGARRQLRVAEPRDEEPAMPTTLGVDESPGGRETRGHDPA